MKKSIILFVSIIFILSGCKSQETAVVEQSRSSENQVLFDKALVALNNQDFVLEADVVNLKSKYVVNVSSNTNFVSVIGGKAIIQLAGYPSAGYNGLGGLTIEGNVSNAKVKTDKKGNVLFSMDVMGSKVSARIDIIIPEGTNKCSATVISNYSNRNATFSGYLYSQEESNIFKGRSL